MHESHPGLTTEEYWARARVGLDREQSRRRPDDDYGDFVFASIPVPSLRGARRICIEPNNGGYRWFVSDSSQLTNPGNCARYAEGWHRHYGNALSEAEQAALKAAATPPQFREPRPLEVDHTEAPVVAPEDASGGSRAPRALAPPAPQEMTS